MSSKGTGYLHIIEGTVNADKYINILEDKLILSIPKITSGPYLFQQDIYPCHTAKKVKEWMSLKSVLLLPWIASSPDMSPIETLWGIMKKELKRSPVKTVPELKARLREIWEQFTPLFCESLVGSMPRRIRDILAKKGGVTNW